jgi:hypothetical protein
MHRAGHSEIDSIDGAGILPRACCRPSFVLQSLVDFYGVEASFPLTTHLITRSLETTYPKRLYFVSALPRSLGLLVVLCMSLVSVLYFCPAHVVGHACQTGACCRMLWQYVQDGLDRMAQ